MNAKPQCPLGFEPAAGTSSENTTLKCKCMSMKNIGSDSIKCDEANQQLSLMIGNCLTYNETEESLMLAICPYVHPNADMVFLPFPPNMTAYELNGYMCGEMNRTGRLCGRCKNGTGPSVFAPNLKCVTCLDSSYGWAAAGFISLSVFVLLVFLFRIKLYSDYSNALVFFCDLVSTGVLNFQPVLKVWKTQELREFIFILTSGYNIFNLQFFQNLLPYFCISKEMSNMEVVALNYLVAIYPLLLIFLIYITVSLYDRNFKPLVIIWRPIRIVFASFCESFDIQYSLISAFANFFLLAYFKFAATSFMQFIPAKVHNVLNSNTSTAPVFYLDGRVTYSWSNLLFLLAVVMCIIFTFFPIVLMLVYPMRTFQKFLNCCGLRCLPLHIFMDAFQGCYKNGTEGTRDYRYFAGLYFVFRILLFSDLFHNLGFESAIGPSIFLVSFSLLFALCRPYKRNIYNIVDSVFHAVFAILAFLVYSHASVSCFSVKQEVVTALLLCTPLFYLVILFGCYMFPKCKRFIPPLIQSSFQRIKATCLVQRYSSRANGLEHINDDENQQLMHRL